jgi:hypothetical protein
MDMAVNIRDRTLVSPPLNTREIETEEFGPPGPEEIGLRFGGSARASMQEELKSRAAQLSREENRIAIAKDALLRKAEQLRSREEALEIREQELGMRRKLFDRRVAELLRRELALSVSIRPLLQ